jgi:GT2 family glycosyltransferase
VIASFTFSNTKPSIEKTKNDFPIENPFEIVYNQSLDNSKIIIGSEYIGENNEIEPIENPLVKTIAFYLPQFHPIPENDKWWGRGFTEWTNVSKAVPQFVGHYQPRFPGELGYYDLRVKDTIKRQIELAQKYGIFGFCFYFYWFNGKRLLEKPLENFLNLSDIDFPFCLCWANEDWTRRWDGRSDQILISQDHSFEYDSNIIHDFLKYFCDPRYILIDGRPLIIVYRANILKDPGTTIRYWKDISIQNGFKEPLVLTTSTFGYSELENDGFDGLIDFPPHNLNNLPELSSELQLLNPEYSGIVYKYSDLVNYSILKLSNNQTKKYFTVSPSWDNEARRPGNGLTFIDSSPEFYGYWLDSVSRYTMTKFEKSERLVFINAWNEWAEGAYLEPDRKFGYAYLQMTYDVLKNLNSSKFIIPKKEPKEIHQNKKINKYQLYYEKIMKLFPVYSNQDNGIDNTQISSFIDNLFIDLSSAIAPLVSIIIPVHNHFSDTLNCLKSLSEINDNIPFEIIIVDDCSIDETNLFFQKCKNFRYIRNESNEGFLRSCNIGAKNALGDYLILLNNDTLVLPGWLENLIRTFHAFPNAGLVGSKLLYPDGTLQEAGGIIWEDGGGLNFGRNDDPQKPKYNYLRDVDYCSGASICVPKKLWIDLKGFDELFVPAYYEDTDLAFRIREKGYEVLYQPQSEVIHLEGKSSGTDLTSGVKKYQEINREKFLSKWKEKIVSYGNPLSSEFSYRNRTRNKKALVIDVCTPKPDQDSGSIDTFYYLTSIRKLGFEVTFISVVDSELIDKYVTNLQFLGIECIYQPYLGSIETFIKKFGKYFDVFFLFRAPYGGKYIDLVKKSAPKSKIVFNTVDLHFLREMRENEVSGQKLKLQTNLLKNLEIKIMKKADQVILVSEFEQTFLDSLKLKVNTKIIPLPRSIPGRYNDFSKRNHIIFIGGFLHKPNIDAVFYFVNEIWQIIHKELPDCEFWIVGSNIPDEIRNLENTSIRVLGFIDDLSIVFEKVKMSVAPLRFGAGIKGKILTSLSYGVPCIATSIATEGMKLIDDINILKADSPYEFQQKVIQLYSKEAEWEKISKNGILFVHDNFSLSVFEEKLKAIFEELGLLS